MTRPFAILVSLAILSSCGPREDDLRRIAREELARAAGVQAVRMGEPIGPYTPGIRAAGFLFLSGQIGYDHAAGALAGDDVASQTRQALRNAFAILREAGLDSSHVVQSTVYLTDMSQFQAMNAAYGGYFDDSRYPARTTVEVKGLPRQAKVEIALIAWAGR